MRSHVKKREAALRSLSTPMRHPLSFQLGVHVQQRCIFCTKQNENMPETAIDEPPLIRRNFTPSRPDGTSNGGWVVVFLTTRRLMSGFVLRIISSFASVILHLSPTSYTPEVFIDPENQTILLRGTLFPEDSIAFFQPIKAHIDEHFSDARGTRLEVHIELVYINSSAQRELYRILSELVEKGIELSLTIYTGEDEEMDDLRHVVAGLQNIGVRQVTYQEGYYSGAPMTKEASPGEG